MKFKHKIYHGLIGVLAGMLVLLSACTKTEEPPHPVGNSIPYVGSTKNLAALLDSVPQVAIFKTAFHKAGMQAYMDSLASTNSNVSYTIFLPTDQAMTQAGYSLEKVNAMSTGDLKYLAGYLVMPGNLLKAANSMNNSATLYPLVRPEPALKRTTATVYTKTSPYFYRIGVNFTGKTLYLNGKNVKNNVAGLSATNGAIFMIDAIVQKPDLELYQVITTDTAYRFYLTALRKSNAIYQQQGILGSNVANTQYNDTIALLMQKTTATLGAPTTAGTIPCATFFVPDNNAFRKAGFNSVADINNYIAKSKLASSPSGTAMLTNMDSILVNHRFLVDFSKQNYGYGIFFTPDFQYNMMLNGGTTLGAVNISYNQGQVTLHRQDFPSGRAANIIGTSADLHTLNGVIHRVDNLMLTTP